MNPITSHSSRLWLLLVVASALLYSGCQTPKNFANAKAGYLLSRYQAEVKGDSDMVAKMNDYARIIAEEKLRILKHGDTLPALRRYLHELQTPIQVGAEVLDGETGLSNSKRRSIADWVRSNPNNGSFHGETASDAWQQELARVDKQVHQLSEQFDTALNQARQKASAGAFEEAAQEIQTATRIDPENAEAQTVYHGIYRNSATAKCDKLLAGVGEIQDRVAARTQHYETAQFSDTLIAESETSLNQAQMQVDEFRTWAAQNTDAHQVLAERETELRQTETQLAGLRGTNWAQKIWLMRGPHQYWKAYQLFIDVTATKEWNLGDSQKHRLTDYETAAFHQRLREAYERMLPEGMSFYLHNAAHASEGQGANGLALVLCRMTQELLNYAELQHMHLAPEVENLQASLKVSLSKTQEALKTSLSRQLIVKDFQSRDFQSGDIGHELATQIYDEWLRRYPADGSAAKPVPFWLVDVKRDAEKTNANDYVLNGSVKQCYADTLTPKELNVERLEVGLEPEMVPNPDPKQAKKTPMIYEQELWIYERRTSQFAKNAIIRADVTVAFGNKVYPCVSINQEFDDTHGKLPGIKLLDQGIEHRAINYKPRRSAERADFKVDHLPPNKAAELSSDREIEAALIDYAKDEVLTNLEVFVAMFPLNNLFQDGLRNEGKPVQAAEGFGRCLEYCSQLAALDPKLSAKTGDSWLDWRNAVADRIAGFKKEQWRNADPGLTSKVDNLWDLSVAAAIQAADQMTREE